jgi:AbrB family looped-hinge helix DNA binding protein
MFVKSTVKGQITIPVALRRKYGITEKTRIYVYEEDGKIILKPITREYIHSMRGMLKGTNAMEVLKEARAFDRQKEEERLQRWLKTSSSSHKH